MTQTPVPEILTGFWPQIEHQLERIRREKPETFDALREILLDPTYESVQAEIHRNFERRFDRDSAFFAGSGGDGSLIEALEDVGWEPGTYRASYYRSLIHPGTGEALTYIEGDVVRGDRLSAGD